MARLERWALERLVLEEPLLQAAPGQTAMLLDGDVVVGSGTIIARDRDSVTVRVEGEKVRDCMFLSMAGYVLGSDGLLRSTYLARADQPATGATRPVGRQSFGEWMFWPVSGSTRLEIWFAHQCEGRIIRSQAAVVNLSGGTQ